MKKFLLLIFGFITAINFAQNSVNQNKINKAILFKQYTITGTVIDAETKQPLEYATIICTPLNGKPVTGGITDANGKFSVNVPQGSYDISVEFISFKTKTFKNREVKTDLNLG